MSMPMTGFAVLALLLGSTFRLPADAPTSRSDFDPFLRLEDAAGTELAQDDDSGGNANSRIQFQPPTNGRFRLVATTFNGQIGEDTLRVAEQP